MSVYCPIIINGESKGYIYIRRSEGSTGTDPEQTYPYEVEISAGKKGTRARANFEHRYGDTVHELVRAGLEALHRKSRENEAGALMGRYVR